MKEIPIGSSRGFLMFERQGFMEIRRRRSSSSLIWETKNGRRMKSRVNNGVLGCNGFKMIDIEIREIGFGGI